MKFRILKKPNLCMSAVIASILVFAIIIGSSTQTMTAYAAMEGNQNQASYITSNNSYIQVMENITTTITNSYTGGVQTDGCPSDAVGQFSLQLTIDLVGNGNPGVQEGVSVNTQGGYSCFGVTQFPSSGSGVWCYGFAIAYSSEFYTSGNSVTMKIDTDSNGYWTSAWLSVASDTWVIYPSNLTSCNSGTPPSLSITNIPFTYTIVNMPGIPSSFNFTAGAGTLQYSSTSTPSFYGCYSITAETSNIYYGTPYPLTGNTWAQSFSTANLMGMCQ